MPGTVLYFPWFSTPRTVPVECWKQINEVPRAELRSESSMLLSIFLYCHISSQWYLLRLEFRGLLLSLLPAHPSKSSLNEDLNTFFFKSTNTIAYYVPGTVLSSGDPVVIGKFLIHQKYVFSQIFAFSIGEWLLFRSSLNLAQCIKWQVPEGWIQIDSFKKLNRMWYSLQQMWYGLSF